MRKVVIVAGLCLLVGLMGGMSVFAEEPGLLSGLV